MASPKVSPRALERSYRQRRGALLELVSALPDRPSPETVHELRVAARRLLATRSVLPRHVRESSGLFSSSLKTSLKETSALRDLDTLLHGLEPLGSLVPADTLQRLANQRSDASAKAKAAVSALPGMVPPAFEASDLGRRKASRRLRKRVRRHGRMASKLLQDVIEDETKVEQLHSLRKEIRKLRYLLELAAGDAPGLQVRARWQDSLGEIRDLDVAVEFLRRTGGPDAGGALGRLERSRHLAYARFLGDCGKLSIRALNKGRALAPSPMPHA